MPVRSDYYWRRRAKRENKSKKKRTTLLITEEEGEQKIGRKWRSTNCSTTTERLPANELKPNGPISTSISSAPVIIIIIICTFTQSHRHIHTQTHIHRKLQHLYKEISLDK